MKRFFFTLFVWLLFQVIFLEANVPSTKIMSAEERTRVLLLVEDYVHLDDLEQFKTKGLKNPFDDGTMPAATEPPKKPNLVEREKEQEVDRPILPPNPKMILRAVADKLKPTGSIMRKGEYFLVFNERVVKAKEVIIVRYAQYRYEILVEYIDDDTFILRLGNLVIKEHFEEVASSDANFEDDFDIDDFDF